MSPPLGELLATGRTARVYAVGPDHVLKVFEPSVHRDEIDQEEQDSTRAHELGLTPIRCHGRVVLDDGRTALELDRVDGEALTTVAEQNPLRIRSVARTLARVHAQVHAVRTSEFPDVRELAARLVDAPPLSALTPDEKQQLREHVRALPDDDSVLHLDFHPLNVFQHHGGHAVIDWQTTCHGPAAADVAMTRLLFTEAELFPGISTAQRLLYQSVRRVMLGFYEAEYRRLTGVASCDVDRWATTVRVLRLGLLDVESERSALLQRIRDTLAAERS